MRDSEPIPMVEVWRGDRIESLHRGDAVVVDARGGVVAAFGDPGRVIYPRSACKMVQALPLIESGAADASGLRSEELALACASHQGSARHARAVSQWLDRLGLMESDLRCGPQEPSDRQTRHKLLLAGESYSQLHNNCSGKHAGFLTLNRFLEGRSNYIEPDHPVQCLVRDAFESMTGEKISGVAIDGCSAPNFATSLIGLATAMARMADPSALTAARANAANRLLLAMASHPQLIGGTGRACTELGVALAGRAVVKTGAEGVFVAILRERGLGIALKIEDGGQRAAEAAIAGLLVRSRELPEAHPMVEKRLFAPIRNRRQIVTGRLHPHEALYNGGCPLL